MNCKQAQPNLLDYSRGLLSRREAHAVKAHLEGCAQCRATLEAEAQLMERLSAAAKPEPRSDVWQLVQSRIRSERRPARVFDLVRVSFSRRVAAALAALVVLIVALVIVAPWRSAKPSPQEDVGVKQAVALMQVQPVVDNPAGGTTDAMMKVLQDEM